MSKFKIGDTVRRTKGSSLYTEAGTHGVGFVGKISGFGYALSPTIIFDNGHKGYETYYELVEKEVTEFKVGDHIRVNAHRNAFGDALNYAELVGKEFIIDAIGIEGVNERGEHGDFVGLGLAGSGYYVRSDDDLTIISRVTPEELEIADLKDSNARLADANEAKRDRLDAIKAIVNADDVAMPDWSISSQDGRFKLYSENGTLKAKVNTSTVLEEKERLPKYSELVGDFETTSGCEFSITRFAESDSGFGVEIHLYPEANFFEAEDIDELIEHLKKLSKRMRKKSKR